MKCPLCTGEMEAVVTRMSFYNEKIKVNPVHAMRCSQCGEETVDSKEYERVRKKVDTLKKAEDEAHVKGMIVFL